MERRYGCWLPGDAGYGELWFPTLRAREWSGSGATDKYWPMTPLAFETNIGDVVILSQAFRKDGKHHIEFRGSGDPRGPLADIMMG